MFSEGGGSVRVAARRAADKHKNTMGCVVSTAIAVLVCKHKCSIDRLTSRMAFHPPSPPSYSLEQQPDGTHTLTFAHPEMQAAYEVLVKRRQDHPVRVEVKVLPTKKKQHIPLFHFLCEGATTTLLWSHANAMDCGEMFFFFLELATRLRVNVAAYDYSGYGQATGEPSESNVYSDALAAYYYLQSQGVDAEKDLVLYGQSIGSAPTLYLATKRKVAGTVLHSPILSGLRFLIPPSTGCCSPGGCCSPVCVYALCDPFPNIKRIRRVTAPVLLMHGTRDETVHHSHTLTLYDKLPKQHRREPYIVEGAGHENVVDWNPGAYWRALGEFLRPQQGVAPAGPASGPQAPQPTVHNGPARPIEGAIQAASRSSSATSEIQPAPATRHPSQGVEFVEVVVPSPTRG